jgi:hypothetical protein
MGVAVKLSRHKFLRTELRMRDVYPESRSLIFIYPRSRTPSLGSWIPDPTITTKEEGGNPCCTTFICGQKNLQN